MKTDDLMQILHDKATRGESLSNTEKEQLDAWYEVQDKLENDLLTKIQHLMRFFMFLSTNLQPTG